MIFDHSKLKGRIIEVYGSQSNFAGKYGISINTLSKKMNNKVRFTPDDIVKMTGLLSISSEDIGIYFFKEKV